MDTFGSIRKLAQMTHRELKGSDVIISARTLLHRARDLTGLAVLRVRSENPLLAGSLGALYRTTEAMFIDDSLTSAWAAYVEAHELGHYWLESSGEPAIARRCLEINGLEETTPRLLSRAHGYRPNGYREQCADLFAHEFLLPRSDARRVYWGLGWSASRIAKEIGLPIGLVRSQLAASFPRPSPIPEYRASISSVSIPRSGRRSGMLGDVPPSAGSIDAVRPRTVHARQGVECSESHLPSLGKRRFPLPCRELPRQPPEGIVPIEMCSPGGRFLRTHPIVQVGLDQVIGRRSEEVQDALADMADERFPAQPRGSREGPAARVEIREINFRFFRMSTIEVVGR